MIAHDEVLAVLEELAPRFCAEPGDEPGFEVRHGESCNRLGVCTDPTERNLFLAASDGTDFIITHHAWRGEGAEVVKAKGISIYRLHSAWDLAPEGSLVTLGRMLGLRNLVIQNGALTGLAETDMAGLLQRAQRIAGQGILAYCGDPAARLETVGIIPGSGFLPVFRPRWEALAAAGCEAIISGDLSFPAARFAHRERIGLIDLGHSGLVQPGLAHLAYLLRSRLMSCGCEVEFYEDRYSISHYTAWSMPDAEAGEAGSEMPGGVVVPFSR